MVRTQAYIATATGKVFTLVADGMWTKLPFRVAGEIWPPNCILLAIFTRASAQLSLVSGMPLPSVLWRLGHVHVWHAAARRHCCGMKNIGTEARTKESKQGDINSEGPSVALWVVRIQTNIATAKLFGFGS